jgi:imidazolonepropionase
VARVPEVSLLIHDLAAAVTPAGTGPLRGREFGVLRVHSPASMAISGERILAVGPPNEVLREIPPDAEFESVDGRGKTALPGLIDCHTHPAFLGDRAVEFELRASGAGYEALHASGGGIRSTVAATREGSEEDLRSAVELHLGWMLEHGTTTAEAKSGYGLDRETELKSLRAIRAAGQNSPVDIHPTFLGTHTVPAEFDNAQEYIDFVIQEVLPEAAPLARFADVFLERGSFEAPEAKRYLEACREFGLALRLHADQFSERGGIPLAVELGARSVDHLEATGHEGANLLAKSDVASVLLPACGLFLDLPLPPARLLADEGAILALGTDFNPGSSFCESLPLVMNLACTRLGLSPAEALCASTVNAAYVLGLRDVGRLATGYKADVLLLDAPDWRHVAYHLGGDRFAAKIKSGQIL